MSRKRDAAVLDNDKIVDEITDRWDSYEEEAPPRWRKARKGAIRKPSEALTDEEEAPGFQTTYRPGRFERGWLMSSLRAFYDQNLLTDVLAHVKGGKEASVYRCAAHPVTGVELAAAKVYRPRNLRSLRN